MYRYCSVHQKGWGDIRISLQELHLCHSTLTWQVNSPESFLLTPAVESIYRLRFACANEITLTRWSANLASMKAGAVVWHYWSRSARHTRADRMAARQKSDRRRDGLCVAGLRKCAVSASHHWGVNSDCTGRTDLSKTSHLPSHAVITEAWRAQCIDSGFLGRMPPCFARYFAWPSTITRQRSRHGKT